MNNNTNENQKEDPPRNDESDNPSIDTLLKVARSRKRTNPSQSAEPDRRVRQNRKELLVAIIKETLDIIQDDLD